MSRISTLRRELAGLSGPRRPTDLTLRRRVAFEKSPSVAERVADQAQHARRLEAVGQLSSGIAHDFNNLLAVILGNGEYLLEALPKGDQTRTDAEAIVDAAQRAAALTKQILAFARRKTFEPTAADLNAVVSGLEPMLRRVIGEDIELTIALAKGLRSVHADPSQLEQVVLNLVINARDAMPQGGKLSIETGTAASNPDLSDERRDYITLTVGDTGCGMDESTLRRAFEPFFTTKQDERGTGLGLSTIHGIIERGGGHIAVESELGRGSVFTIYLPKVSEGWHAALPTTTSDATDLTGTETILVVEDDERVRMIVRRILDRCGYRVLEARDGSDALAVADAHEGFIHLVLSDVVMPGASGPQVVKCLQERSTGTKALFMSGYTSHPMLRDAALQDSTQSIQKPFAPDALARKVREVLNA